MKTGRFSFLIKVLDQPDGSDFMKKYGWLCLFWMVNVLAAVSVTDDTGRNVILPKPAQRVISLAPHTTELIYYIGAGSQLAAVTRYSDYPSEAGKLPVVGDFRQIDLERVLAMKPDLLVVWQGGNPQKQLERLKKAGIPVFYSDPRRLGDIPDNMVKLGILTGHEAVARKKAAQWGEAMNRLKKQYGKRSTVRVFYQVSNSPLFTLNGKHIVNEAISLCGGTNVFADLSIIAPNVSIESVIAKNPEAIISSKGLGTTSGLSMWKRFRTVDAVRYGNLFGINSDWMDRAGPRMLSGTETLCKKLDESRKNMRNFR